MNSKITTPKKDTCPVKLYLAPMEGLGSYPFRNAIATIGGFDEATREFISIPKNAHVKSLVKKFDTQDTHPIPQAVQLMGSCEDSLAYATELLNEQGVCRVELNVGCPSNTVTGKGSGSSLLQYPEALACILTKMVKASSVPVTAKLRSGYLDTTLFEENLLAAESSGISHLTLHPRTKVEGYKGSASLDLIKRAKEILSIPLIGNGDIKCKEDAEVMLAYTHCDGLMIGRGAVINPWVFHEIKGDFKRESIDGMVAYLEKFYVNISHSPKKNQIGQLKQIFSFLFQRNDLLLSLRRDMLRSKTACPREFFENSLETLLTLEKTSL